jgi:hypothetical protein
LLRGSDASQQFPDITILDYDGNDSGDPDFNLEKWFLETRRSGFWGWAGRNGAPLWKLNELFWDDDATPARLAAALTTTRSVTAPPARRDRSLRGACAGVHSTIGRAPASHAMPEHVTAATSWRR